MAAPMLQGRFAYRFKRLLTYVGILQENGPCLHALYTVNTQIDKGTPHSLRELKYYGQPAPHTHPHQLKHGEVTSGLLKVEYLQRRKSLIALLQSLKDRVKHMQQQNNVVVILPSAPVAYMSPPTVVYPYRQDTDFSYFTGFLEPNSVLTLSLCKDKVSEKLFVTSRDATRELWDGPCSGIDGAVDLTGIEMADSIDNFINYMESILKSNDRYVIWYDLKSPKNHELHNKLMPLLKDTEHNHCVLSPVHSIHKLRNVKSQPEINLMKKSAEIASKAFISVMQFSHPNVNEAHLYAKMDYECRMQGATMLGYIPVVAGGNRANTIHYIKNDQIINGGYLVLMDAGCDYHGYQSDITRTWPVSGQFSPVQRRVYNAVLRVQLACIAACKEGFTISKLFDLMLTLLGVELKELGIISPSVTDKDAKTVATRFCVHNIGHYLGMDVHDTPTLPTNQPLKPAMIITIEPGLYFPYSNDQIPEEFQGIGIRIEDDILITSGDPIILSHHCPKHPDHIEEILAMRATDIDHVFV